MSKVLSSIIAGLLGASGGGMVAQSFDPTPPPASAATVSQGDRILVKVDKAHENKKYNAIACTIGGLDPARRIAYTAGHCFREGNVVTNEDGTIIGNGSATGSGDRGIITLKQGVHVGDNKFTHGNVIHQWKPNLNATLCFYGSATKKVSCGRVTGVGDNGEILSQANVGSQHGDSGGPVWLKHTGALIGTTTGTQTTIEGTRKTVEGVTTTIR